MASAARSARLPLRHQKADEDTTMSIRLARSLGVALVLPTLATLAALAHAQTSADARHHPGTLRFERIEQEVPNATTLAAGRAMLAVFDSALAALPEVRNPRGY